MRCALSSIQANKLTLWLHTVFGVPFFVVVVVVVIAAVVLVIAAIAILLLVLSR